MNPTLQEMARLLVGIDYEEGAIFDALHQEYPQNTTEEILTAIRVANGQAAQCDADLRAEAEKDDALAFAAEHDLTKTMHRGGNA